MAQKLDTLMAAYRMTQHRVTGVTPNLAMLGREVLLPATPVSYTHLTLPTNREV